NFKLLVFVLALSTSTTTLYSLEACKRAIANNDFITAFVSLDKITAPVLRKTYAGKIRTAFNISESMSLQDYANSLNATQQSQPADQDDSGLASGDINIPVTPLSQSVTPPSQDADQLSNDGDGISQSSSSSQQSKDQGFVSGVPTPMPATPPAIKPIAPVIPMPGPVITPTRINEPLSKPIAPVNPITPATIVPAAPKGQDNFPPVPPTPTPAPMFNGNTFNQPQSGSTSTGNTPPPAPIFNNSTGKFDQPQSGTSPLPGTPGIAKQTNAQYPYLDQFNKLKAPKGLNDLEKQINDSLKINVKTVLDDDRSAKNLEVFLTASARELKKVDSIRSMEKTYNGINLSNNYIELLELVNQYINSIVELKRILASSKSIDSKEAMDAAQKWVEDSNTIDQEIEEEGHRVFTESKDENKMLEAMDNAAQGIIDDLTSLKNAYTQSLVTLKRRVNDEFSSAIESAQRSIFEIVATIMFVIEKHRLSNNADKGEFLSKIDDYIQKKTTLYQNKDKGTALFQADNKIIKAVFNAYKEIMESSKEINPGDVAILFSSEEQQKLVELDRTNSLIRVMSIPDKIKIQGSEPYAAIKSLKKEDLVSKGLNANLYTVNKEPAGAINIGLKQKISNPLPARIALGYTAKIVAPDYDADGNALIAFVGPAVANPLVDICIMPTT
ncbi:hypothetical protein EBU24_05775, partial [bacterium]|nr:hypothetical protein [bacterium]